MTRSDRMLADDHVRTATTANFVVHYPITLRPESVDGFEEVELVLTADENELVFRPNVVFTSVPSTAPLVDASTTSIIAASKQHPGARFVSVDVFFGAGVPSLKIPIGRVITFTYPLNDALDVVVKKWVFATGEHHLHVSASFLPSQASVVEGTFDWIASNLRFHADLVALQEAASGTSQADTLIDEEATAQARHPLEDLSIVPLSIPASAKEMPVNALEMLMGAWGVKLRQPKVLHVVATRNGEQGFYAAYTDQDGILVVRSGGSSGLSMNTANVECYPLGPEQLPADAFAWMANVPAFRFGDIWKRIPLDEYNSHFDGRQNEESWTEFQIHAEEQSFRSVFVPGEGFFESIAPLGNVVELDALPSGRLFGLILHVVDLALGQDSRRL